MHAAMSHLNLVMIHPFRDLKMAVDAGLLAPYGEKRGRHYVRGPKLVTIRGQITESRDPSDTADPFQAPTD
jgi:hypothetical protein